MLPALVEARLGDVCKALQEHDVTIPASTCPPVGVASLTLGGRLGILGRKDGVTSDRLNLRPIYDAIIAAVLEFGEVVIQARKTYVSLVSPRRTFARVQPTTKTRLDLGLRLEGQKPGGRLRPSTIHETMKLQIDLTSVDEVDAEVLRWLRQAYEENC